MRFSTNPKTLNCPVPWFFNITTYGYLVEESDIFLIRERTNPDSYRDQDPNNDEEIRLIKIKKREKHQT